MEKKEVFIFEDYTTGGYLAFHTEAEAKLYAIKWYIKECESRHNWSADRTLEGIKQCTEEWWIDDECCVHEVEFGTV